MLCMRKLGLSLNLLPTFLRQLLSLCDDCAERCRCQAWLRGQNNQLLCGIKLNISSVFQYFGFRISQIVFTS